MQIRKWFLLAITCSFSLTISSCQAAKGLVLLIRDTYFNNPAVTTVQMVGPLELAFELDQTGYDEGEPVQIQFSILNTSETEEVLRNPEGPALDILLESGNGEFLRWSEQQQEYIELGSIKLQSQERLTIEWIIPSLPDGRYNVEGIVWLWDQEFRSDPSFTYGEWWIEE